MSMYAVKAYLAIQGVCQGYLIDGNDSVMLPSDAGCYHGYLLDGSDSGVLPGIPD